MNGNLFSQALGLVVCLSRGGPVAESNAQQLASAGACPANLPVGCKFTRLISESLAAVSVEEQPEVGTFAPAQAVGAIDVGSGADTQLVDVRVGNVTQVSQGNWSGTSDPGFICRLSDLTVAMTHAGINFWPSAVQITDSNVRLQVRLRNVHATTAQTALLQIIFVRR